jgi:hypothetical protein
VIPNPTAGLSRQRGYCKQSPQHLCIRGIFPAATAQTSKVFRTFESRGSLSFIILLISFETRYSLIEQHVPSWKIHVSFLGRRRGLEVQRADFHMEVMLGPAFEPLKAGPLFPTIWVRSSLPRGPCWRNSGLRQQPGKRGGNFSRREGEPQRWPLGEGGARSLLSPQTTFRRSPESSHKWPLRIQELRQYPSWRAVAGPVWSI